MADATPSQNPAEILAPVAVGLAELKVERSQALSLTCGPVGAGLGIAVFDPVAKAGALLHVLLPDSSADWMMASRHPGLFLDTGLAALLKALQPLGATPSNMLVCVAGGARIIDDGEDFNIGGQNRAALETIAAGLGLKIHAVDLGGSTERTLRLNLMTGQVRVKAGVAPAEKILCQP